jgi:hypothetical protein
MKKDSFASVTQTTCDHAEHRNYTQRQFDMLNGYEMTLTRCLNCHKTLKMDVKKLD